MAIFVGRMEGNARLYTEGLQRINFTFLTKMIEEWHREEDTAVKEYEERSKRSLDMHKSKRYVGKNR